MCITQYSIIREKKFCSHVFASEIRMHTHYIRYRRTLFIFFRPPKLQMFCFSTSQMWFPMVSLGHRCHKIHLFNRSSYPWTPTVTRFYPPKRVYFKTPGTSWYHCSLYSSCFILTCSVSDSGDTFLIFLKSDHFSPRYDHFKIKVTPFVSRFEHFDSLLKCLPKVENKKSLPNKLFTTIF